METYNFFPFDKIRKNSKIIIYGYGVVGKDYVDQVASNDDYTLVCVADRKCDEICESTARLIKPESIYREDFDYIVIANKNLLIANDIRTYLGENGISEERIIYENCEVSCIRKNRISYNKNGESNINCYLKAINSRKKVVIGNKRRLLDWEYIFEKNYGEYTYILYEETVKFDYDVLDSECFYIVNDIEQNDEVVECLKQLGLKKNVDYTSATEFAKVLDLPVNWDVHKKNVVLFGDKYSTRVANEINDYYGSSFVDDCILLNNYDKALENKDFANINSTLHNILQIGDIKYNLEEKLNRIGFHYYDNAVFLDWEKELPSEMFVKMYFSRPKNIELCIEPMNKSMEILSDGSCFSCCINWLNVPIGNIKYGKFKDIWNSPIGRLIQLSMCNHTFAFCDLEKCSKKMNEYSEERMQSLYSIIDEKDYRICATHYPKEISVSIDPTCNLFCGSCRKERVILDKCKKEEIIEMGEKIIADILPNVSEVKLAGNGEVFASKIYRDILYSKNDGKKKKLDLLTNGQLLTEDNFEPLKEIYSDIILSVSIDAARKETYEDVRRGGKWINIVSNMEYASRLRRDGFISRLQFNFVYSKKNYLEMPEFVEWAKKLGVDNIYFSRILFMPGVMTYDEYNAISLHDDDGMLKTEYVEFFRNNIFKDPIVDRSSIPNL